MNIIYISNWPMDSGLTQSSIIPVIKYFQAQGISTNVTLVTPEDNDLEAQEIGDGIYWNPIKTKHQFIPAGSFFRGLFYLLKIAMTKGHAKKPDLIWARGSQAGGAAFLISKIVRLPFIVESYEPHSLYMVEGGIWPANGVFFKIHKYLETQQLKHAKALITVSEQFQKVAAEQRKTDGEVFNIPCAVPFKKFAFSSENRMNVRHELQIPEKALVGIYVGKFGDIYYDTEFFQLLRKAFEIEGYQQIILTPMKERAKELAREFELPLDRVHIDLVGNEAVSSFLSAADVGYCPVKQTPSKIYCSPIKSAEYMANGLPVLISEGIGDDSAFIKKHKLGWVIDFENLGELPFSAHSFKMSEEERKQSRENSASLASSWRDVDSAFKVYHDLKI